MEIICKKQAKQSIDKPKNIKYNKKYNWKEMI